MKATQIFVCLVLFLMICEIGFGDARPRRQRGKKGENGGNKGKKPAKMCYGVLRRSGRPADINCTRYDIDVNADLEDIYGGQHEDVFREWIELIQAMTSREMESEDDGDEEDESSEDIQADQDDDDDVNDDELTIMCERKLCFTRKLKQHLETNDVPSFCQVEGRSAEDWQKIREAERPERERGVPAPPMTVERYTTIFCAKAHNPRNPNSQEEGERGKGNKRRGGKGKGKGNGRRGGGKGTAKKPWKGRGKPGGKGKNPGRRGPGKGNGGKRGGAGRQTWKPNKKQ